MAKTPTRKSDSSAHLGFEAKLWLTADKLRNNMDADRDREVMERACGEVDRSASSFLPNLKPGEAAIIGADFPIPLTIQIFPPEAQPKSDGPNYQKCWQLDPPAPCA